MWIWFECGLLKPDTASPPFVKIMKPTAIYTLHLWIQYSNFFKEKKSLFK